MVVLPSQRKIYEGKMKLTGTMYVALLQLGQGYIYIYHIKVQCLYKN